MGGTYTPYPYPFFKNPPHTHLQTIFIAHSGVKQGGFFGFQMGTSFIAIPNDNCVCFVVGIVRAYMTSPFLEFEVELLKKIREKCS